MPNMGAGQSQDECYKDVLLAPLRLCASHKPAFGRGEAVSLVDFKALYGQDPLYHWIGLDSEFMYAAHKASSGMTSVYRQLGTGCERLIRRIIQDCLELTEDQTNWSYEVARDDGSTRTLTLDARISLGELRHNERRDIITQWSHAVARRLNIADALSGNLCGSVFEIRQGYKSQDAKRQNADMQSALRARSEGYIFVMAVVSSQISTVLRLRYQNASMLVLTGDRSGDPLEDTFAFIEQIIGFPITDFFIRNSAGIRHEVGEILQDLLSPS